MKKMLNNFHFDKSFQNTLFSLEVNFIILLKYELTYNFK